MWDIDSMSRYIPFIDLNLNEEKSDLKPSSLSESDDKDADPSTFWEQVNLRITPLKEVISLTEKQQNSHAQLEVVIGWQSAMKLASKYSQMKKSTQQINKRQKWKYDIKRKLIESDGSFSENGNNELEAEGFMSNEDESEETNSGVKFRACKKGKLSIKWMR